MRTRDTDWISDEEDLTDAGPVETEAFRRAPEGGPQMDEGIRLEPSGPGSGAGEPTPTEEAAESHDEARRAVAETAEDEDEAEEEAPRRGRPWWVWALGVVVIVAAAVAWFLMRPTPVRVVLPEMREVVETIAASGRVAGRRETAVGAQAPGILDELYVDEGDVVNEGQPLARVRAEVAAAQVRQAEQALRTAQARLAQVEVGARPSELAAARARVRQQDAMVRDAAARLEQARAAVRQAEAQRDLARTELARYRALLRQGAVARQTVDQRATQYEVAQAQLVSARRAVDNAQAGLAAARAALAAARAEYRTVEEGPRRTDVDVVREQVREARAALDVARQQAQNTLVRAPFPGTVTEILTEPGAQTGPTGILRLAQTGMPEVLLDVDESNLADLDVGQPAVITSDTFGDVRLDASVTQIGAAVDPTRGTVEVTVAPERNPDWLRPGQTVDVNIITNEGAQRLVVPSTAVERQGERRIVLLAREGRAVAQPVITGPLEGDLVPVLEGLSTRDRVIRDASKVEPGERVTVRSVGEVDDAAL